VPGGRAAQVALESQAVQVASGNPAALVESDQQDAPAAERVPDRRPVRAEVAAPTKWEIVAFPPEQVHAEVLLAVVAGIMLEQVAAGVARAWAAAPGIAAVGEAMAAAVAVAITAAVVVAAAAAAVVAVAAAVAAAAAAVEGRMNKKIMISKLNMMNRAKTFQIASTIVIVTFATVAFATAAEPKADASATPASNQKQFATAKEAADALVQAATSFDQAALKEILGPESDDLVVSEDPVQDKNRAVAFAEKAKEKSSL